MRPRPLAGEVERFRALIERRLGLQLEGAKLDLLADLLDRRCGSRGVRSSAAYLDRLGSREAWGQELSAIAGELTVGETYFFRNAHHFRAFEETVLPARLGARRHLRRLSILSAGCASGEEAYSLAILLHRHAPELAGWDVDVLGIDVNPDSLARARRGLYSAWSLRETPADIRAAHFRAGDRGFLLDEAIRRSVRFEERNLLDADAVFWRAEAFDVVFCRNVTMYLTPDAARLVIARIAGALAPGGFLFLGYAETLRGISQDFHLAHTHDTFYYRRRLSGDAAAVPQSWAAPASGGAPAASWVDSIRRAAERISTLSGRPTARRPRPPEPPAGAPPAPATLARALALLREERFAEAVDAVRALPPALVVDPDAQLLLAVLLTNSGELSEAEEVCRRLLERDELHAGAHYVLALCRQQAGDSRAAVDHDQTAAYLDPGFAMPHVHLGLIARRAGDLVTARRELEQASTLLRYDDPARILLFGGGFTRETLVALCRAELAACGHAA
ncbi:MAG TPA: CheR family methyltransferase [Candidatus Binatia bacterium]|nr:CheR family methyltransferase [Candidatus Binatia bacterium]